MPMGPKSSKIHIKPEDSQAAQLEDLILVRPYCGRPVSVDMTMEKASVEELAAKNMSPKPFCVLCIARSGIKFKDSAEERKKPVLKST